MAMSNTQFQIASYVEQYWHEHNGTFPPRKALARHFKLTLSQLVEVLESPEVKRALTNRGISEAGSGLSPEQIAAANTVLNFADRRSLQQKLEHLEIRSATWHGWLKSESFKKYLAARSEEMLGENMFQAHQGLLASAARGDTGALKLFYEITGRYNPKAQSQLNVRLVVVRLLEAIQKFVPDPDTQLAIQREFLMIMGEGEPTPIVSSAELVVQAPQGAPVAALASGI